MVASKDGNHYHRNARSGIAKQHDSLIMVEGVRARVWCVR